MNSKIIHPKNLLSWFYKIVPFCATIVLFVAIALFPLVIIKLEGVSLGIGMIPTILYVLPLILLFTLPRQRWITILLTTLVCIASVAEVSMLLIGKNLLESGMIVAILTTTAEEAAAVMDSNLSVLWYVVPMMVLYVFACIYYYKIKLPNFKTRFVGFTCVFILVAGYYLTKTWDVDRSRYKWYEDTILSRPPYHFYCQLYRATDNIITQNQMANAASEMSDFSYRAKRSSSNSINETYILCIGESMRYGNVSINGTYPRTTTPNLEELGNLISYTDYYSTACLTMYAVPLLITPATPSTYEQSYLARSIFAPFEEIGFKTFILATKGQLLLHDNRDYLRLGVDSIVIMNNDSCVIDLVKEITTEYPKSFILIELWGSHHPYYNYPQEFDIYTPTNHTDPAKYTDERYFINAYDNSILYTDYILSSLAKELDPMNICAAMLYTSDHGESISNERYGHGFEHYPEPVDLYKVEYHVPLMFWYSDKYEQIYPTKVSAFESHKHKPINANYIFYSSCGMADIDITAWSNDFGLANHNLFEDSIVLKPREILLTDGEHIMNVD